MKFINANIFNANIFNGKGFLIAVSFTLLTACGGGGSGSSNPNPNASGGEEYPLDVFAGNPGGAGYVDGVGTEASFNDPQHFVTDSTGNLYVADALNSAIRKITPAGVVSTLAGTGGSGAAVREPSGVAIDSDGNFLVSDRLLCTIVKITPEGVATTLAGHPGWWGYADGTGDAARFCYPRGLAIDSADNLYVADDCNYAIRRVTPAGVVTTLAGGSSGSADGTGSAARFSRLDDVVTDGMGNLYVADTNNNTIRKIIIATGEVTTLAGTAGSPGSTDGTGAAARFNYPLGVTTDSVGNVYVADTFNYTIRRITPAGVVTTLAGTAGSVGTTDSTGSAARFGWLGGITADSADNLYVTDTDSNRIRKITPTAVVTTLAGQGRVGSEDGSGGAAGFSQPQGIASDSAGNLYIADTNNNTVRMITSSGMVTTLAGTAGNSSDADGTGAAAGFEFPKGIAVDSADNIYVADTDNNTIRKITPTGEVTTLAGMAGSSGSADGTGAVARFTEPSAIAVDSMDNLYVADTRNHTIRKITPAGEVTTLAGTAGNTGSADGTGAAASFDYPEGIAVDSADNIYVADSDNNTIRMITPAGEVTTLAGTAGPRGSVDGTGAAARFANPQGIAVDSANNLYVADTWNRAIRKITPAGVVTTVVGVMGQSGFEAGDLPGLINRPADVAIVGSSLYIVSDNGVAIVRSLP